MLIDVLLVVGDDGLGDGLTDSVDLRGVTTTANTDTDVDVGCELLVLFSSFIIMRRPF